jgi:hypothetical protein
MKLLLPFQYGAGDQYSTEAPSMPDPCIARMVRCDTEVQGGVRTQVAALRARRAELCECRPGGRACFLSGGEFAQVNVSPCG